MKVKIHPLRPENDRSQFACGDPSLDRYVREFAWQNMSRHSLGVTWVAEQGGVVLGYVTVAAASMRAGEARPRSVQGLPLYPLPVLRVARLAVDERFRGSGIGTQLLGAAFDVALDMRARVGCVGVVVDAKPEAVRFYERFGFTGVTAQSGSSAVRPLQTMLFLPIRTVEAACE